RARVGAGEELLERLGDLRGRADLADERQAQVQELRVAAVLGQHAIEDGEPLGGAVSRPLEGAQPAAQPAAALGLLAGRTGWLAAELPLARGVARGRQRLVEQIVERRVAAARARVDQGLDRKACLVRAELQPGEPQRERRPLSGA